LHTFLRVNEFRNPPLVGQNNILPSLAKKSIKSGQGEQIAKMINYVPTWHVVLAAKRKRY
jgi:hypothetical protein